ncbi:MAG: SH3 domain-containing protein [Chloroflexi bacterium]|nr:SH3 domain-containing protein [Chloroflexota bacterium]
MRNRTVVVPLIALFLLAFVALGCSVGQLLARQTAATGTPTRTPRPTWTPAGGGLRVATPTLDRTRFPNVALPTAPPPTPQQLIPGSGQPIFVPQPPGGGSGVQTVVVIIVTATPIPSATAVALPSTPAPPPSATPTPGPPTATPTITPTPLPPVVVNVLTDDVNVRQGPSTAYPIVAQLDAGTEVTVVGRNRAGDWWKICCVNGADVWIFAELVSTAGPLWTVPEVLNIPPPPSAAPPPGPTATPTPTPTYAWPFRVEGIPEQYVLGQDFFRVDAIIYNGATPLWGYKLRVRKLSTGQEWLSNGSVSHWQWVVIGWPNDGKPVNPTLDCPSPRTGLLCLKSNVKWDSNGVGVPMGDDVWEVVATDGAGTPLSAAVRLHTSAANAKWYYIVFTSRK